MVNLDNIKHGDRVLVGVAVDVDGEYIGFATSNTIRDSHGNVNPGIKVIGYNPKTIDQPKGIGAVVKVRSRRTGNAYKAVNVGLGTLNWAVHDLSDNFYTWEDVTRAFLVVEVVSEGVEVDTD